MSDEHLFECWPAAGRTVIVANPRVDGDETSFALPSRVGCNRMLAVLARSARVGQVERRQAERPTKPAAEQTAREVDRADRRGSFQAGYEARAANRRRHVPPPRVARYRRRHPHARARHRLRARPGQGQARASRQRTARQSAVRPELGPLLARCDSFPPARRSVAARRQSAGRRPDREVQQERIVGQDRDRVHHRDGRRPRKRRDGDSRWPRKPAPKKPRPRCRESSSASRFNAASATTIRTTIGSASSSTSSPRSFRGWPCGRCSRRRGARSS